MGNFIQDLKYAVRMLIKSPGFAAAAVITLALGIGANTAIFSFVNAWIIKPLAYPQSDQLYVLLSHDEKKGWTEYQVTSTADFFDYQNQGTAFQGMSAWTSWQFDLTGNGSPVRTIGGRVSWNFFNTLGVKPMLGRDFLPEEDQPGAGHAVILSRGLWESRFAGDPHEIGRTVTIDGESYVVVGVMPADFLFPLMGRANLWTPLALSDKERTDRAAMWLYGFGRLKPGVTPQQASAEIIAIAHHLQALYPKTNTNQTTLLSPMTLEIGKNEGTQQLQLCFWIVGLVLLIACANVANLLLARAAQRTKEFAVRGALGATRGRVIRQLLTESGLLFLLGGGGGVLFGAWGLHWIESSIPDAVRGYLVNFGRVDLDWITLSFTFGIALFCGMMFGLAPALQGSRLDLNRMLKEGAGQVSGRRHAALLRRVFVTSEIALAVVVLISTTLLVESFVRMVRSDLGFQPQKLWTAQVLIPKTKYAGDQEIRNFYDRILGRVRALPQVAAASASVYVPFGESSASVVIHVAGRPPVQPGEEVGASYYAVLPDYFSTMRIPLERGRGFTGQDGATAPHVALINETLARQQWPKENPIGQQMEFSEQHSRVTIVGIVQDVRTFRRQARPQRQMYVPFAQFPSSYMSLVVRAKGDDSSVANAIRDAVWAVDPDQPVSEVKTMNQWITESDAGNQVMTQLIGFFGALALFLCVIGIYAVMAHSVAQRTHEIGIRMALGAEPVHLLRMIVGQGMRLTLIGIVCGTLAALGSTQFLAFVLYNTTPRDPAAFTGVAVIFAMVAFGACWIPARRAMRVDPLVALRHE
ncbi:MAG: ABC transporter permease [Candidatus Acidiferrales bacterium]